MRINENILKNDEKAIFGLRELYQKYGYSHFRMNRFEEYDLYSKNKDFLISDSVITFTDTNGKLMALKPDVTFSIIKNSKELPGQVQKVYYNENVYRIARGTHDFKEIVQAGLECVGDIDVYNISEVLLLAAKSLETISNDCILDISHMGFIDGLLDEIDLSDEEKADVINLIGQKNVHDMRMLLGDRAENLVRLTQSYGGISTVIEQVKTLNINQKTNEAFEELNRICSLFDNHGMSDNIRFDFSVINDMKYYNGIVFKGFINGISSAVLSGGQYDKLMHKMNKKGGAIGFAVYLDLLQRFNSHEKKYDVDLLLLYSDDTKSDALIKEVNRLVGDGKTVLAVRSLPHGVKYKKMIKFSEGDKHD